MTLEQLRDHRYALAWLVAPTSPLSAEYWQARDRGDTEAAAMITRVTWRLHQWAWNLQKQILEQQEVERAAAREAFLQDRVAEWAER